MPMDAEKAELEKLLGEMVDALREANNVQAAYAAKIDELEKENRFLSETIEQKRMGLITEDRRGLLEKMRRARSEADMAQKEAAEAREAYEEKLDRLAGLTKGVLDRERDIGAYIDTESEKKIAAAKKAMKKELRKAKADLEEKQRAMEEAAGRKIKVMGAIIAAACALAAIASAAAFAALWMGWGS